jgi:hypothetical protein
VSAVLNRLAGISFLQAREDVNCVVAQVSPLCTAGVAITLQTPQKTSSRRRRELVDYVRVSRAMLFLEIEIIEFLDCIAIFDITPGIESSVVIGKEVCYS